MLRFLLLTASFLSAAPAYWTQKSVGSNPVAPFTLARTDTIIARQVHDTADSVRAYARARIHDTADTLRKYTRDRIKDSLVGIRAALPAYVRRIGDTITGPIVGTTATAAPLINITTTFGNLTNAAIRGTASAEGGAAIHGVATGINAAAIWGVSSNTGGEGGLFSGTGGANAVRAIATGGGKAGLFQGDVQVMGATTLASSLTGILKGSSGTVSIATAPDFPTLNQSTTGSAAKWTTPRTLTIGATGKAIDGTGNQSWSLAEIGAQAAGSYLHLAAGSGDPLSGTLYASASGAAIQASNGYINAQGAVVGTWNDPGAAGQYAMFQNSALYGATNAYALIQNITGATYLNSAAGKEVHLRINNGEDVLLVAASGNTLAGTTTLSGLAGSTTRIATVSAAGQIGAATTFPLTGVTDGSSASSGIIGEIISASASGTSFTGTSAGVSLVSISLPAGSWLVWGSAHITNGASPVSLRVFLSYSPTGTTYINANTSFGLGSPVANSGITCHNAPTPINSSSTATVYLIGSEVTTGAVAVNTGATIYAQRIR